MPPCQHLRRTALLTTLVAVVAVVAIGCGGDDDGSDGERAATSPTVTDRAREPDTRERRERAGKNGRGASGKGRGGVKKRLSKAERERERARERREAERDRKEDREFDRAFRETAFEKLVGQLPVRKPPLYVEQYITQQNSHRIYTAVDPKRFFCGKTPARRKAAVSAFYREASRSFRRRGIDDFVQVVTPLAETVENLPALAVAREGSVSLTKRGRAKRRC